MTEIKTSRSHRILLVDDDSAILEMMRRSLEGKGFDVTPATCVTDALRLITTELFDVLITDLHMPNPSDGFAVITAMRHSQPDALTLLLSGYPDVKTAMDSIVLQADEILVKPFEIAILAQLVRDKIAIRKPAIKAKKERVAAILERCTNAIVADWLVRVKKNNELAQISLTDQERTGHLPKLIDDLIARLKETSVRWHDSDSAVGAAAAATAHGKMRQQQGYTPGMLVQDSRILQVTLFGTLQSNLSSLDFSLLLPDVMTIADEVDSQLTHAMNSFMIGARESAAA